MAIPLQAGLPLEHDLTSGWVVSFTAIDPTTGVENANVVISDATLVVAQLSPGTAEDLQSGPFLLVPGPNA